MPETPKKFYLTTPIYYVNARPHIGHAYTTIVADVVARRHRLLGDDTYFLTGTDEHGQKIERSAAAAGIPPQQFADQVAASFEGLWKRMGMLNDSFSKGDSLLHRQFIRTTDAKHQRGAQKLFQTLFDRGYIELRSYTGTYCVSDEAFVDVPVGTPCPECGRITETITEENYFFKLSEFQEKLIERIESTNPGYRIDIQPEVRKNEVLSFLRGNVNQAIADAITEKGIGPDQSVGAGIIKLSETGVAYVPGALKDLSISRTSFKWGIPVPGNEKHVIYVWLDALANYMTAVGYGSDDPADIAMFERYWPADLHLVGKEIIRFHCVYWPAFLMAAELPLPKKVQAHGWLLFEESKMSKSRGNIVRTETILDGFGDEVYGKQFPESTKAERDLFASDVLRYFLLREIPFGQDGSFSFDALWERYNADLTNGYGNLVSRTLTLVSTNFPGGFTRSYSAQFSNALDETALDVFISDYWYVGEPYATGLDNLRTLEEFVDAQFKVSSFNLALSEIFVFVRKIDTYLAIHKPWKLAKLEDEQSRQNLESVLYNAAEAIRYVTALLYPILPYATAKVWTQLGLGDIEAAAKNGELKNLRWGGLKPGTKLGPLSPIFPRADKGLAQIMSDMEQNAVAKVPTSSISDEPTTNATAPPAESTHPGAAPRTSGLAEENAGAKVAGSHALSTERPGTPSHSEAAASGVFATGNQRPTSSEPLPALSVQQPATSGPTITIDDFVKIDLRVGQIVVAERIPKADKLLRLEVDLGPNFNPARRQILSGIAEWYTPEELIGRRIAVIANLAPRKMRGLESHGMLLAASDDSDPSGHGKPVLASFSDEVPLGSRVR